MRRILLDNQQQLELSKNGYISLSNFLSADEVQQLKKVYHNNPNDISNGFHATTHSKDFEYRRAMTSEISKIITPKAQQLLDNYRPIVGTFTIKEIGKESFFDFHLDWNMVNENVARSVTIWTALDDTNKKNGNLWILKGSNSLGKTYRCSPGLNTLVADENEFKNATFDKIVLEMNAGDAILYDHKLFHGSPPNLSNKKRMAINMVYLPEEIPSIHYTYQEGQINAYEVDDDFYHRCLTKESSDVSAFKLIESIPHAAQPISQKKINRLIKGNSFFQNLIKNFGG